MQEELEKLNSKPISVRLIYVPAFIDAVFYFIDNNYKYGIDTLTVEISAKIPDLYSSYKEIARILSRSNYNNTMPEREAIVRASYVIYENRQASAEELKSRIISVFNCNPMFYYDINPHKENGNFITDKKTSPKTIIHAAELLCEQFNTPDISDKPKFKGAQNEGMNAVDFFHKTYGDIVDQIHSGQIYTHDRKLYNGMSSILHRKGKTFADLMRTHDQAVEERREAVAAILGIPAEDMRDPDTANHAAVFLNGIRRQGQSKSSGDKGR